ELNNPGTRAKAQRASHDEVRLLSTILFVWLEVVIPHAQVQGQSSRQLPVILHVAGIVPLRVVYVGRDRNCCVVFLVHQHVRHRGSGIRYTNQSGVLAVPVILPEIGRRIDVVEADSLEGGPKLQRVVAPDLRHIVENLVDVLRFTADANRAPLLDGSVDIAQWKAEVSWLKVR